jgi:opacity protein-like surface antigen
MGIRWNGTLLAIVTTVFVMAPGASARAQFNLPGAGGANTSDRMGGGGGGKGATQRAKNLNTSRSNVDRMGGGGGGKGAAGSGNAVKLNSSRSN